MQINYTRDGNLGITTDGWLMKRSNAGWLVFDADDVYVGRFDSKADAAAQAVAR